MIQKAASAVLKYFPKAAFTDLKLTYLQIFAFIFQRLSVTH
jgi:hypothetical protein